MKSGKSSGIPIRRRPPVEQDRIARWVRQRITRGTWKPGDRLPSREVLLQRFKVSSLTMQRAMDQLTEDGFVEARGPRGTFVADFPPHQYRVGLAFTPERHDPGWSNLWTALLAASRQVVRAAPFRFETYLGVDKHLDTEGAWRLGRDIERGALAGVVVDHYTLPMLAQLSLPRKGIPAVRVMGAGGSTRIPCISPDLSGFYDGALSRLKAAGCRRVAAIALGNRDVWRSLPDLERQYGRHGLKWRPEWIQGVPAMPAFEWSAHTVRLLMSAPRSQRPDGLIVADDNLAVPVATGLQDAGIRVPEELQVIALCNWPTVPKVPLDFQWLGFDMCDLLDRAVAAIHGLHLGDKVPSSTRLEPVDQVYA